MQRSGHSEHVWDGGRTESVLGLDPEWLSATIGAIYDCALDPAGWPAVIRTVSEGLRFESAALGIIQIQPAMHETVFTHAIDDEWLGAMNGYMADSMELWGGAGRMQAYPLDEPIVSSHIMPEDQRKQNRYYREILAPRGLTDAVAVALVRAPRLIAYATWTRNPAREPIGRFEIEGLRLIAPHLRRAVTIANLFDLKAVEGATFRSVVDGLSCAVILVDADLRIVHANAAGEAMVATGDPVQAAHGRLAVENSVADEALRAAVALAAKDEVQLSQRGIGIPATSRDGLPTALHVLPLSRREVRSGLAQRAVAAVFVVGADAAHAPVEAIATIYNFTPAESQIFASLSQGTSLPKTAEALGIAKSTARTHLLRIFAKTGCKRQAELVALAARLTPSL
jgi:DNA-binding CsgD family transcriptional regulator/PAS domain-containing protein